MKGFKEKNIGTLMNDFDMFMGLIQETFIDYDKIKNIVLNNYFHKFMVNLTHENLKNRKHFIARETLTQLRDDFMETPFVMEGL